MIIVGPFDETQNAVTTNNTNMIGVEASMQQMPTMQPMQAVDPLQVVQQPTQPAAPMVDQSMQYAQPVAPDNVFSAGVVPSVEPQPVEVPLAEMQIQNVNEVTSTPAPVVDVATPQPTGQVALAVNTDEVFIGGENITDELTRIVTDVVQQELMPGQTISTEPITTPSAIPTVDANTMIEATAIETPTAPVVEEAAPVAEPTVEVPAAPIVEEAAPVAEPNAEVPTELVAETPVVEEPAAVVEESTEEPLVPIIQEEVVELNLGEITPVVETPVEQAVETPVVEEPTPVVENIQEDQPAEIENVQITEINSPVEESPVVEAPVVDIAAPVVNIPIVGEQPAPVEEQPIAEAEITELSSTPSEMTNEALNGYINENNETKFCDKCGTIITDGSGICPSCSNPID